MIENKIIKFLGFCGWLLGVKLSALSPLRDYGVKKYASLRIGYPMFMY
jgi:hypothetical protein